MLRPLEIVHGKVYGRVAGRFSGLSYLTHQNEVLETLGSSFNAFSKLTGMTDLAHWGEVSGHGDRIMQHRKYNSSAHPARADLHYLICLHQNHIILSLLI